MNFEKAAALFGTDENHAVAGAFVIFGCFATICGLWTLREAYLARTFILLTCAIRGTVLSAISTSINGTRNYLVVDVKLPDGERRTVQGRSNTGAKLHPVGRQIPVQYHAKSGRLVVLDNPTLQQRLPFHGFYWLVGGMTVAALGTFAILLAGPIGG